jgi:hypothetical protein
MERIQYDFSDSVVKISVSDPDPHGSALNCLLDPDPDPAADKISSKSQNNSYHLELFD